jgi:hypothetical protein
MTVHGGSEGSDKRGDERLRAADDDRQWVADRLRSALDQGRLGLIEYDDRVRSAYQAQTYAELNALLDDLPSMHPGTVATPHPAEAPVATPRAAGRPLPTALVVLWTIWGAVVGINLVVWLIVMVSTGEWLYPWPVWVAGPAGVALFAVTSGVQHLRNRP